MLESVEPQSPSIYGKVFRCSPSEDPQTLRPMDHLKDQPLCLVDLHLFRPLFRIGSIHPIFGAPVGEFWVDEIFFFFQGCPYEASSQGPKLSHFDISKHCLCMKVWYLSSYTKFRMFRETKLQLRRLDPFLPSCFWCQVLRHVDSLSHGFGHHL